LQVLLPVALVDRLGELFENLHRPRTRRYGQHRLQGNEKIGHPLSDCVAIP
jgi:hypothetical protein